MKSLIRRCPEDSTYTLRERCPRCGAPTAMAVPPRYSPEDRYGVYRRKLKRGGS
jgi:H/ACA ribonucleoprotein complex subunit 3